MVAGKLPNGSEGGSLARRLEPVLTPESGRQRVQERGLADAAANQRGRDILHTLKLPRVTHALTLTRDGLLPRDVTPADARGVYYHHRWQKVLSFLFHDQRRYSTTSLVSSSPSRRVSFPVCFAPLRTLSRHLRHHLLRLLAPVHVQACALRS